MIDQIPAAPALPPGVTAGDSDGTEPCTPGPRPPGTFQGRVRVGVTTAFVVVPFAGLAAAVWLAWGHSLNLADILLAVAFYVITGAGGDRRLSPAAAPPQLYRGPRAAGRARDRGVDDLRGRGHRLGRHPPPP